MRRSAVQREGRGRTHARAAGRDQAARGRGPRGRSPGRLRRDQQQTWRFDVSDKRSVATDALETLGMIIDGKQRRDAIHLAVEPVVAGERLQPGARITVVGGVAHSADDEEALGIVDPFLINPGRKGQRVWFVMLPRMVHSLRHVWTHPAFQDEAGTSASQPAPAADKAASERWLHEFCDRSDCPSYEEVMGAVAAECGDEYLHFDDRSAHGEIPPEFWVHVEVVLGRKLKNHPTYFSCSC